MTLHGEEAVVFAAAAELSNLADRRKDGANGLPPAET